MSSINLFFMYPSLFKYVILILINDWLYSKKKKQRMTFLLNLFNVPGDPEHHQDSLTHKSFNKV